MTHGYPAVPPVVMLHGRIDEPTDGVWDYCANLAEAMRSAGRCIELASVNWPRRGWLPSLVDLWGSAGRWRGTWVLIQYTALSWSRKAFPIVVPGLVLLLRARGARPAVVYHDPIVYPGRRLVDRIRRTCQRFVMWSSSALAERSIQTVDLDRPPTVRWKGKARVVPSGSNIVPPAGYQRVPRTMNGAEARTVMVFGFTPGRRGQLEVDAIRRVAVAATAHAPLRIVAVGRGTAEVAALLEEALSPLDVDLSVEGLVSTERLSELLASADVELHPRGAASTRRTSVMAAVAFGTPVVGYRSDETRPPITEAGLRLVPEGDVEALGEALVAVLTDPDIHAELVRRNQEAWHRYFSPQRLAEQMILALDGDRPHCTTTPGHAR